MKVASTGVLLAEQARDSMDVSSSLAKAPADVEQTAEQSGSSLKQNAHVCGGVLVGFMSFVSLKQISIMFDDFRPACHTLLIVCAECEHFAHNFRSLRMRVVVYSLLISGPTIPRDS